MGGAYLFNMKFLFLLFEKFTIKKYEVGCCGLTRGWCFIFFKIWSLTFWEIYDYKIWSWLLRFNKRVVLQQTEATLWSRQVDYLPPLSNSKLLLTFYLFYLFLCLFNIYSNLPAAAFKFKFWLTFFLHFCVF